MNEVNSVIKAIKRHGVNLKTMRKEEIIQLLNNKTDVMNDIKTAIIKQNSYLYLKDDTFDGGYCVFDKGVWLVYRQERGVICSSVERYSTECEGLTNLLISEGYIE